MRKAKFFYEQYKTRFENTANWKGKMHDNHDQKRKGIKYYNGNSKNTYKGYQGRINKHNGPYKPPEPREKETSTFYNKNTTQREPLKCWECGDPHYYKECPSRKNKFNNVHMLRGATTVGDMARRIPTISASL